MSAATGPGHDFTRATYRGGQIERFAERVSVRYFFDFASPFGHRAGAGRSPPDRHDFWRSFPGAAAIGHCSPSRALIGWESPALDTGARNIASTGCCETVDGIYVQIRKARPLGLDPMIAAT